MGHFVVRQNFIKQIVKTATWPRETYKISYKLTTSFKISYICRILWNVALASHGLVKYRYIFSKKMHFFAQNVVR